MAEPGGKESESGVFGRLAGRGEDALTRLMDELGRNPRVTDALGRAMSAKGKVDETTRRTLAQVGLSAADEVRDLRQQVEALEKRVEALERAGHDAPGSGRGQGRKPATATKSSGGSSTSGPTGSAGSDARSPGSTSGS